MNLYISGPMTGMPEYNTPAFDEVARRLREMNHEVFNPADADRDGPRMKWAEYMARDLPVILTGQFDAIVQLPGWWGSNGAFLEAQTAWPAGVPLVDWETRRRVEFLRHGNFLLRNEGDAFTLE